MTPSHGARRRWLSTLLLVAALLVAGLVLRRPLVAWFRGPAPEAPAGAAALGAGKPAPLDESSEAIDHYTCSMHPSVRQQAPGKCPICGMDLVAVTTARRQEGIVTVDAARRQLIGVRVAPVIEAPLDRSFRASGRVTYDESTFTDVNLRVSGWINELFVDRLGQRVSAGQRLFLLYSPELYNAEQDFLLARQGSAEAAPPGGPGRLSTLGRAARQRLHLLGLGEAQLRQLEQSGKPSESIAVTAPASGFIIEKDVVQGAAVQAGARLYRIAALDRVWVEADVYEADLAHVRVGQDATVTLDYLPGGTYEAKLAYVQPSVDAATRTGRVRVELPNPELELRPGMYASVALRSSLERRVQVPAAAVVYTGPRRLVFVDLGEGRFRPQEIQIGALGDGTFEVISGLQPGELVATSGVFLIAAEARISTAATYWDRAPLEPAASGEPVAPGGSPKPFPPPEPAPHIKPSPPVEPVPPVKPPPREPAPHVKPSPGVEPAPPAGSAGSLPLFSCPMHPHVQSATPGSCPECGMALTPVPARGAP